jgi:hypothetical protein
VHQLRMASVSAVADSPRWEGTSALHESAVRTYARPHMNEARAMPTLVGLWPFAIGIAAIGLVTWFLLRQNVGFGPWLLAALLVAHGWVHVMFIFPRPKPTGSGPEWPFDLTRSWLARTAGLDVNLVRTVGIALMSIVVAGLVLAALSILGLVVPAAWWAGLLVVGAAASFAMLVLFFSPQLVLGLAIDIALVWLAIGAGWSPDAGVGHTAGFESA